MGGFWEQSSRRMRFLVLMLWMPSCTKGVLRVLLTKRNQTVVGLQQIDDINIRVIVLSR